MCNENMNRGRNFTPHRNNQNGGNNQRETAESAFNRLIYKQEWITNEATEELVSYAEEAGRYMAENRLTNSKIRSIYCEIKRIQMGVFEKERASFLLLKPKVAYALARDNHNEGLKLFKMIFDRCSRDVCDQKSYQNFCNIIEAILAYHKVYGGKD